MKIITTVNVGGTLVVMIQHCAQDLHITTETKSMDQEKKKKMENYVHTGDSVGVVMGTTKGELSFAVNDVNLGVAFEGIPLDKPLVPCVLLYCGDDSVELII